MMCRSKFMGGSWLFALDGLICIVEHSHETPVKWVGFFFFLESIEIFRVNNKNMNSVRSKA